MLLAREFPPNPHAVVFHADDRLTDEIVEAYVAHGAHLPPSRAWMTDLLALSGVRVLSVNAYKIRVQKVKTAHWNAVLPSLEALLAHHLGASQAIEDLRETECRRRAFPWHGPALGRRVFEGRRQAHVDPLAWRLFALEGVAEVILDGNCVEVRKSPLFAWTDLAERIEMALDDGLA